MYKINTDIDVPIYTQLSDMIKSDILSGRLSFGAKLPTVRELSIQCGVAPGTVIRVYEQLELLGLAEKIQGKGTFVSFRESDELSRKDKAMAAIDAMLDTLETLNFSESETNIFLNLKLRERAADMKGVQLAFIECNNEVLHQVGEQLKGIGEVSVYTYHIDDVRTYPYQIPEDLDLIVVSAVHAEELSQLLPSGGKMIKIALALSHRSVSAIARIPEESRTGILCQSMRFGELLVTACGDFCKGISLCEPATFSSSCGTYLENLDVLLVPRNFERFCSPEALSAVRFFAKKKQVIQCEYRIDSGSMIYLQDRINKIKK